MGGEGAAWLLDGLYLHVGLLYSALFCLFCFLSVLAAAALRAGCTCTEHMGSALGR